jgi:chromosome segregation ATPase
MDQPTIFTVIITIVSTVGVLLGGKFGVTLLERLSDQDARQAKAVADEKATNSEATATASRLQFADNEQARIWLREQLDERDAELRGLRERERLLLERVGSLAEQVARQEERSVAQAVQITALQQSVEKWNTAYEKMEKERDMYRDAKHDSDNALSPAILKASILERDVAAKDAEIERLKGQLEAVAKRET